MRIIKLKIFPVPVRLHTGYGKLIFVIISPFFAIFKKVVHSLEPGETPSYSVFHQAPNYAQLLKYIKTFLNGCGSVAVNFSIYLCSVLFLQRIHVYTVCISTHC